MTGPLTDHVALVTGAGSGIKAGFAPLPMIVRSS